MISFYYNNCIQIRAREFMLKIDQLENALIALVKGKSDIILYGNKSSGKTYLSRKVLDTVLGKDNYVNIKCIFVSDRNSLLYLLGDELSRLLLGFNSKLMEDQKTPFPVDENHTSLEVWIRNLNRFMKAREQFFKKLPRIYIFLDNIEDFVLSEIFFKEFYFGIKTQLKYIKVSFFFCGIAHVSPLFNIHEPARLIPCFYMPHPKVNDVIAAVVRDSQLAKKAQRIQSQSFKKLVKHVEGVLNYSFESIQYEIERIWLLAQTFLVQVNQYVGTNQQSAKIWVEKNQIQEKELLNKLKQFGAVTLERTNNETVKKNIGIKEVEEGEATFYIQNYPSLVTTSLGLANGFPESEDIKRFVDMKKNKSTKQKANMKKKHHAEHTFKYDAKKVRHTKQRIISIAETLEQQSNGLRLKEKNLPHHSLDYYGCFEYVREQGYINFYGKNSKFGGTITGNPKESEVKDFMKKLDLSYFQFTGRD